MKEDFGLTAPAFYVQCIKKYPDENHIHSWLTPSDDTAIMICEQCRYVAYPVFPDNKEHLPCHHFHQSFEKNGKDYKRYKEAKLTAACCDCGYSLEIQFAVPKIPVTVWKMLEKQHGDMKKTMEAAQLLGVYVENAINGNKNSISSTNQKFSNSFSNSAGYFAIINS